MAATVRFDTWENSTSSKSVTIDQIAGGSGLVPVVPSSVSVGSGSASVGANGKITFTNSTTITLDGIFSSTYENYRIVLNATSAGGGATQFNFRTSAGNDTSAIYDWNEIYAVNTTVAAQGANSGTVGRFSYYDPQPCSTVADILRPNLAAYTNTSALTVRNPGGSGIYNVNVVTIARTTTQYTGLYIVPSASNLTGTITVYGYR